MYVPLAVGMFYLQTFNAVLSALQSIIIGASPIIVRNGTCVKFTKSLLNENGLPHTAADLNAHSVRKTLLKEYSYGLPHTVAGWYVRRKH